MTDVTEAFGRTTRWTVFASSQIPLFATVALLLGIPAAVGALFPQVGLLWAGIGVLVLTAAATLALPWQRIPIPRQSVLAVCDLAGIILIAVAVYGPLDHFSLVAAYPAVWLAVVGGARGAVVGILGTVLAAALPVVAAGDAGRPVVWASVLAVPVVISAIVAVAAALTGLVQRTNDGLRAALAEVSSASAESQRIATIMRQFADQIELGMGYVPDGGGEPFVNAPLEEMARLAGIEGTIGFGDDVFAEDQVTPVPAHDQPLGRMMRGESIVDVLYWVGRRGRQRALLCNSQPVVGSDGVRTGAVIVVQDVTDLLRAERDRGDALATLAHELRTPLTSIVGYADLLSMDPIPAVSLERVDVITRNVEHLLKLTTVFLDGLHGPPELEREPTRLRAIVDAAMDVMRTVPGFTERAVSVDVSPDLEVSIDRAAIATVLSNLLTNAVKFSAPGDAIRITAGEDDAETWVTVHDTGPAIATEDLERIFDRFYRGQLAQQEAVAGTGIGLSVSREIVTAHGGTLVAEPVDEGACFRLTLPRT